MSIFDAFKRGLKKTAVAIGRGISGLFTQQEKWDDESFLKLENELIAADFGVQAARKITHTLKDRYQQGEFSGRDDILTAARNELCRILREGNRPLHTAPEGPTVILMVGVNGSGKTTMIKLMSGILTPTSGEITISGKNIGIETKKIVSYLPERTYLNDWMKVRQP